MREIILNKLYRNIGYTFKKVILLEQALTHRSSERKANNERLEFLGDSLLGWVITEELFRRFPICTEGELTRLRSSLVKGETLAKIGLAMGLGEALHLGLGELNTGGFRRKSTIEDALEALIGAIYLDSDFSTLQPLILKWFEPLILEINASHIPRDYKSHLQEVLQARNIPLPTYLVVKEEGPDHDKIFFVTCTVLDFKYVAEGQGHSKKIAEQIAAQKMLEAIAREFRD